MSDAIPNERCIEITDLDDPRLTPFWNLRERTLRGEAIFIAEGVLVVERLIKSPYKIESVLVTRKETGWGDCFERLPEDAPIYYVDEQAAANRLLGFEFHQGILALGRRLPLPNLLEGMEASFQRDPSKKRAWVVLPDATKPENLGLAFRCAAALGAEAVVLGEKCCDPFSRRALRVSMGGVLQAPIYQAKDILEEIKEARRRWNVPFYATVLDPTASSLYDFDKVDPKGDCAAFVFGNEYTGLTSEQIAVCDRKTIIPMNPDVDSLNLGVSVGIFLYEFNRLRQGN